MESFCNNHNLDNITRFKDNFHANPLHNLDEWWVESSEDQ